MKLLLIGAGNMGGAMIQGLQQYDITVVQRNRKKAEELKEKFLSIKVVNEIPNIDGFIVILAVKPNALESLKIKGTAYGLISILAGVNIERLRNKIDTKYCVRAMPNMAAQVQKSATSMCGDKNYKYNWKIFLVKYGRRT